MSVFIQNLKKSDKIELVQKEKSIFASLFSFDNSVLVLKTETENKLDIENELEIYIYNQNGIFGTNGKIISNEKQNEEFFIKISLLNEFKCTQRREFLRVDMNIDIEIQMNKNGEKIKLKETTKNLCAKGLCFIGNRLINKNYKEIKIKLFFNEKTIETMAQTVYSNPVNTNEGLKFINGFCFTDIIDEDVNFITEKTINYLKTKEE